MAPKYRTLDLGGGGKGASAFAKYVRCRENVVDSVCQNFSAKVSPATLSRIGEYANLPASEAFEKGACLFHFAVGKRAVDVVGGLKAKSWPMMAAQPDVPAQQTCWWTGTFKACIEFGYDHHLNEFTSNGGTVFIVGAGAPADWYQQASHGSGNGLVFHAQTVTTVPWVDSAMTTCGRDTMVVEIKGSRDAGNPLAVDVLSNRMLTTAQAAVHAARIQRKWEKALTSPNTTTGKYTNPNYIPTQKRARGYSYLTALTHRVRTAAED